jgi:hypothetical protein
LRAWALNQSADAVAQKIRECQRKLEAAGRITAQPATLPSIGQGRTPHPAPQPGQVLDLAVRDLGNFDYDPQTGGRLPDDVKRLSGTVLRTRGFMLPLSQTRTITEFALVPSLFACCFGQPPQIQHMVLVHVPPGKPVSFFPDEIIVEGRLKVAEKREDGYVISLFEMDAQSVRPVGQEP